MVRKQIIPASTRAGAAGERRPQDFKDVPAIATVLVTSESIGRIRLMPSA